MTLPRALLRGPWPLPAVTIAHVGSSAAPDAEVDALVDAVWSRQLAAAPPGLPLTDGSAYRMESACAAGEGLALQLSTGPYRRHSALKELYADARIRPEHHDRTLVVDTLVTTVDQQVLLLRTPKPVGVELQLVGGTATPGERVLDGGADVAAFATERLHRALDGAGTVTVGGVLGLVEHVVGCVNLVLDVRLETVAADLTATGGAELVVVPRARLAAYLRDAPGYLPAVVDLL